MLTLAREESLPKRRSKFWNRLLKLSLTLTVDHRVADGVCQWKIQHCHPHHDRLASCASIGLAGRGMSAISMRSAFKCRVVDPREAPDQPDWG